MAGTGSGFGGLVGVSGGAHFLGLRIIGAGFRNLAGDGGVVGVRFVRGGRVRLLFDDLLGAGVCRLRTQVLHDAFDLAGDVEDDERGKDEEGENRRPRFRIEAAGERDDGAQIRQLQETNPFL